MHAYIAYIIFMSTVSMCNFYDLWISLRCSRCWGQSQTQFQEEHLGTGTSQLLLISKNVLIHKQKHFIAQEALYNPNQTENLVTMVMNILRESLRWRKIWEIRVRRGQVRGKAVPSQGWSAAKPGVMRCQVRDEALPSRKWCAAKSGVRCCRGWCVVKSGVRRGQVRGLGAAKSGVRRGQVGDESWPRMDESGG
jgi:hypothetical protein